MSNGAREKTHTSLLAFDFVATSGLIVVLNAAGLSLGASVTSWLGIVSAVATAALAVVLLGAMRAYDPMTASLARASDERASGARELLQLLCSPP